MGYAIVVLSAVRGGVIRMRKGKMMIFYGCLGAALLASGIFLLTKLTDPGYGDAGYRDFKEDSGRYEALFLGNSHMGCAVYPMELWRDQGIASYNMAGSGNPLPATYWVMRNALHDVTPKVVVIDCYRLSLDKKIDNKERLHIQTDPLPLRADKVRMVCDLLEKPEDRLEFIWSFPAYHGRWQELEQTDFEKKTAIGKGGAGNYDVAPPGEMAARPVEPVGFVSAGTEYLRGMIEECQSRNIEVLLIYLPFPASEADWQEALCMEGIAEEYGISCINFLDLQVADFASDCYDANSHLNASGGRKVTKYLGQYIAEHYDVEDHRGEAEYAGWDEDYTKYTERKLETLEQLESLDNTLVMLADESFDCCIYVDGDAGVWQQNEMILPLVANVAGQRTEKLVQAAAQGRDYLLIVDHQKGEPYESVDGGELPEECSLGSLYYEVDEDGERHLCLQDKAGTKLPESPQEGNGAVRIFVTNSQGDGTVRTKRFDVGGTITVTR